MFEINSSGKLYNTINNIERIRTNNERSKNTAQRRNIVKTAAKIGVVSSAVPFTSAAIMFSGVDEAVFQNANVTYHIPKFFEKSETLKNIGYAIDEKIYYALDKTASFLRKPKAQEIIEKTDGFVDNIATKVFKQDNELKYVTGGMTVLGLKILGGALLGGIVIKHFINRNKINKDYEAKQELAKQYQLQAIEKHLDKTQNL